VRFNSAIGLTLILSTLAVATAHAQVAVGQVSAGPVALWNVGLRDIAWQAGGGGELLLNGPYSVGGDVDFMYFPEAETTFGNSGHASAPATHAIAVSGRGAYYFDNHGSRRVRPFATGGLLYLADAEPMALLQVSGGADWWTSRRTGLRIEVRAALGGMLAFRAGLVFR